MFRCGMVLVINKPTHVTRYTAAAIDHMFTNSVINTEIKSAIIKADISDHFLILFVFKVNVDVKVLCYLQFFKNKKFVRIALNHIH